MMASLGEMPAVLLLNANDEVEYQTNNITTLFKKLNAPLEAQHEQSELRRLAALAQKKEALKQRAIQTKNSISYQTKHNNITFILKGNWEENLSTQLTPVRWNETDTIVNTTKPYLAQFEVKHTQYPVYQLLVLVSGKAQEITITAGFPNTKQVRYAKTKNGMFHLAIQTIDESQAHAANYDNILKRYPFQGTAFIAYIAKQAETAKKQEQKAIENVSKAKALLQRYAEVKREQIRQRM